MSTLTYREITRSTVPCQVGDPNLWFADDPVDLERAKALCADCPIRAECLTAALQRQEPWGVWGGQIIERGTIVACKHPRGRPRKIAKETPKPKRGRVIPYQPRSVRQGGSKTEKCCDGRSGLVLTFQ